MTTLKLTPKDIIDTLHKAEHYADTQSWGVVQQLCRQVLEAIAASEGYTGMIQYERSTAGYRVRIVNKPTGYTTWGFHFRWLSDAAEYVAMLQEIGYDWESEELSQSFAQDLMAEEKNDVTQLEKAEWYEHLETMSY